MLGWAVVLVTALAPAARLTREFPPQFEEAGPSNLTVQEGDTAVLGCKVGFLEDESVAWVRRADSHILAVDKEVFISDPRQHLAIARLPS